MSMTSPAILSNFFEKQCTQNQQYLSGLSRALYPTTFLEITVYNRQSNKQVFFSLEFVNIFT